MKIVIPIHDKVGIELRYTLRAIERHESGHSGIVLLGIAPKWLKDIDIVEISDMTDNPYLNVYAKCLYMEEDFILFNDDMFLTADTDLTKRPNIYFNDLVWRSQQAKGYTSYQQQLIKTQNFCADNFRRIANYEVHQPMIIERQALEFMRGNQQSAYLFRSISGNFSHKYAKQPNYDVHFKDSSVLKKIPNFVKHIKEVGIFSVGTNFYDKHGRQLLRELYPIKSKWER